MSLKLQTIFSITKNPSFSKTHFPKPLNFQFPIPNPKTHFPNQRFLTPFPNPFPITKIRATFEETYSPSQKNPSNDFNFDVFLSILEFLTLASSSGVSIYIALTYGLQKQQKVGSLLVWQCVGIVIGVVIGAVIRRRQWRRICGVEEFSRRRGGGNSYYNGVNLMERVEKLGEDLRSSATIIRVLSRQLEKLGIRFRVTRKALKEPIAETAALVQKNSEATRALAAQEDNLEKELGEIQKALLAMQEQQRKQLELILAIAKAGKLWDTKPTTKSREQKASPETSTSKASSVNDGVAAKLDINQMKPVTSSPHKETNNDRP